MDYLNEFLTLSNGIKIPRLGLGTWQIPEENVKDIICEAAKIGYRHFDTAIDFDNEEGLGLGINSCGIDRKELFVTTKLLNTSKSLEKTKETIYDSLEKMNLEYFDLILIGSLKHANESKVLEAWHALEELYKEGKTKAIGLCNFSVFEMEQIMKNAIIKPQVCQMRIHIGHYPKAEIEYCHKNNIVVVASSPIGTGKLRQSFEIMEVAKKYNVSVSQLAIKYLYNLGLVIIPKTTHVEYMKQNCELDFKISETDMDKLKNFEEIIW